MRRRTVLIVVALVAVLSVGGIYSLLSNGDGYKVRLVMPSAANLAVGSPVWIGGMKAGEVDQLDVRNDKAIVTVGISSDHAPLHDGTRSYVDWNSAVGERMLTLQPGPNTNPEIPNGGMFAGEARQIEVDQVLAALDQPTRDRLASLLQQLNGTVDGHEQDLQATLKSAGPAVGALGDVLQAVGRDGPAIRSLVTQLQQMSSVAAGRQNELQNVVRNVTDVTGPVAQQQSQLSKGLAELPATLRTAQGTLDRIPAATDATTPLLQDLQPATRRLPSIARNLSPLLSDLRPAVAQLRPMLGATQQLLQETPGLIDTAHGVVPPVTQALQSYEPAVAFLRPYTPEGVGMLSNWAESFAPYDSQGHVWAGLLAPGTNADNESLVQPPGSRRDPEPKPGQPVGQPWTDASGSGMR